jgi:hypothetical protein
MAFDPKRHVIRVQGGREYLPVSARLVWFRGEHPDWGIVTNPIEINLEKQYAIFSAQIFNAEGKLMASATKFENVRGFQDFLEKAETGAVGRALALCGYGTQFAPELEEGPRFQGSPMGAGNRFTPRSNGPMNGNGTNGNSGMRPAPQRSEPAPREEDEIFDDEAPVASPAPRISVPATARPAPSLNSPVTRVREPERENIDPAGPDDVDEDPFGEEDEAPAVPVPAKLAPARAEAKSDSGENAGGALNRCSVEGCSNVLTASQMTMSTNKFGKAVCLLHQRDMAPTAAATGGSRRANPKQGGETLL